MAAGGGVSDRGSHPERGRRRLVTRPLLLRGPPHDPSGAEQEQAVRSTGGREPDEGRARLAAPGREEGGVRPPGDPAASVHREQPALAPPALHGARPPPRPARCSPPPLQGAPRSSGRLGAVAALPGRARLGSSPALSHSFAHLRRVQNGARRRQHRGHRREPTGLSRPARGHLPLKPAGRLRPFPAPSRRGSVGGPPRHVLRASPPIAPRARPLPRRPPAPPGAGGRRARANSGRESDGGRGEC